MNDYVLKFSIETVILYISVGLICMILFHKSMASHTLSAINKKKYYIYIILVLSFLAAIRKVDTNIGGTDSLTYITIFKYGELSLYPKYHSLEILFKLYCSFIRLFTNNFRVFFFITYGIIAASYCIFFNHFVKEKINCIPMILVIFVYLKSFCTLRTGLAVAIFLLGLTLIDRNKFLSLIIMCSSVLVHRMSILYVLIFIFYLLFRKLVPKLQNKTLAFFLITLIIVACICARALVHIIIKYNLLSGDDLGYIRISYGKSILPRWPMYFAHFVLGFFMIILDHNEMSEKMNDIKTFCIFDIIALPVSVILGFWRANEYLYIARLIMWGYLIDQIPTRFHIFQKKHIETICLLGVIFWLVFRLYSEWDDLNIIPYLVSL